MLVWINEWLIKVDHFIKVNAPLSIWLISVGLILFALFKKFKELCSLDKNALCRLTLIAYLFASLSPLVIHIRCNLFVWGLRSHCVSIKAKSTIRICEFNQKVMESAVVFGFKGTRKKYVPVSSGGRLFIHIHCWTLVMWFPPQVSAMIAEFCKSICR
jgi:hypothetical protein